MFKNLYESEGSWLLLSFYLFSMEAFALYYQHILGFEPCALCVQIRAAVFGAAILSLLYSCFSGFGFGQLTKFIISLFSLFFLSLSSYLSYTAYQIEVGNIISTCSPGNEFPEWFPIHELMPYLFKADGLCGVSPELINGYTMNEALLFAIGIPLVILFVSIFSKLVSFFK